MENSEVDRNREQTLHTGINVRPGELGWVCPLEQQSVNTDSSKAQL